MPQLPLRKLTLALALIASLPLRAQTNDLIEEIVVFGRSTNLTGVAQAASEGSVGGADLLIRPLLKTAELLESTPGLVAVQHSGSGKANQYFLRGFNLDHGTDYTAIVDGMPWNLRSHGHGQGYLDVNGLIPEMVERIDYRKGPYRADLGDFSVAGASFIHTIDHFEQNFLSSEIGQDGWRRVAGGGTEELSQNSNLSFVGEYKQNDGPWQQPENLRHLSLWGKYLNDENAFGRYSASLSAYHATWDPTEQVPERAIGSAVCADAFCSLDPTAKGETTRLILTSQMISHSWSATLYGQYYDWTMASNPTYDYQINQFDKRWTLGGSAERTLIDPGNEGNLELVAGAEFRYDDGSRIGVEHTEGGVFVEPISANAIKEGSFGAYTEATWQVTDTLRAIAGVRGDYYNFKVDALNDLSVAGSKSATRASPKLALAWNAFDDVELYANWGRGFHSNDARGVVNSVDPVPALSPATGYELGGRWAVGDLTFTGAYWWLDQDSELIFVGDSNSVEPKGGSKREGVELTMFWQPLDWLGVDGVYTRSEARYTDNPEGSYVEGAVESSAQIGLSATYDNWDLSLRARYLGPYALTADNSQRAQPLTTVNLRGAWHWEHFTVYAEALNLLDSDRKEIVYYYPAYVPGLDPADQSSEDIDCSVTNCTISRAADPRSFRMGVSYRF
ncbi:MAG: TonB-dependent receptor [Pseudomonadales bacterium]|nr:TonB-dependent receptor [Pseudomonadales bacterium]